MFRLAAALLIVLAAGCNLPQLPPDLSRGPVEFAGVQVELLEARIGYVELSRGTTNVPHLSLTLQIRNKTAGRRLHYYSWDKLLPHLHAAHLVDEAGNDYPHSLGLFECPKWHSDRWQLDPGESCVDTLVFQKPTAQAKRFFLRLPLSAIGGGDGAFVCTIPRSAVREQ